MRKAILGRFVCVLAVALIISNAAAFYVLERHMLHSKAAGMEETVRVIAYALDNAKDIQKAAERVALTAGGKSRITVLDVQGRVIADSDVGDVEGMENHLGREEIDGALNKGVGYAVRNSETTRLRMIYTACMSADQSRIVRLAEAYEGIFSYAKSSLPLLLLGFAVSLAISVFIAVRFTDTIVRPLGEIASELEKLRDNDFRFEFRSYKYKELNTIAEAPIRLSAEIREYVRQIEFEKKVRQEFFSNASHELKTPITSIKGYAELLGRDMAPDEESRRDMMRRIIREADHMTNLINDILMISRLEANDMEETFSEVRMCPLVKDTVEGLRPAAAQYGVTLEWECGPVCVYASAGQLRELVENLLTNGMKYNHPGGTVRVTVGSDGENLEIVVRDDGMGISVEDKARIFERFYRVDKGRSRKMGGTGLGLSIVKHIVEFYDGTLELESEQGKGSEFRITLPVRIMLPDSSSSMY